MNTMDDFKAGKIAVWAETEEEAKRFLGACEAAGVTWIADKTKALSGAHSSDICSDIEYTFGYQAEAGLSYAAGPYGDANRGYHSRNREDYQPPFVSVTVAEFFAEEAAQ